MSGERLSMRKIREVLRLRLDQGLPQRAVAQSLGLSQGAVHGYVARARRAGLSWPLPEGLDDSQLDALLYPPPPAVATDQLPVPDWAEVHRELRRPNMTLALLWRRTRGGPSARDGFGYSWFCDLYRAWVGRLKPTLRQVHTAGERVFVDFAGHTMEVIDGATGERNASRSSSPCSVLPATSLRKPPGHSRCRTCEPKIYRNNHNWKVDFGSGSGPRSVAPCHRFSGAWMAAIWPSTGVSRPGPGLDQRMAERRRSDVRTEQDAAPHRGRPGARSSRSS